MKEREQPSIPLERIVLKKIDCPPYMDSDLVEKWGDGIPKYEESDPNRPEWRPTPIIPIDLTCDGYGQIFIKNEADPLSNRTRTIKDRAAWELATLYRDYARALYLKIRSGNLTKDDLHKLKIPRFSVITAGNEGMAVAECFQSYDLPAPKIILDKDIQSDILEVLKKLRADIYLVDLLRRSLMPEDIRQLSDNDGGVDITSV